MIYVEEQSPETDDVIVVIPQEQYSKIGDFMLGLAALARGLELDASANDEAIQQTVEACLVSSENDPESWIEYSSPQTVGAYIPDGKGLFTELTRVKARQAIARSVSKGYMAVTAANEDIGLLMDFAGSARDQVEFKNHLGLSANSSFEVIHDRALIIDPANEVAINTALSLGLNMTAWQNDNTYDRREEGPPDLTHVSLGVLEEGVYVPVVTVLDENHPVRKLVETSAQNL